MNLAAEVLVLLRERGATLAVAESLTGGLVAAELTAVPGASQAVRGSVTAYATAVKRSVLGVDPRLLEERGAVDPQVAEEMARGVRRLLGADYAIATTGVAGPEPQDGKAVGTVYVAVVGPEGSTAVRPAVTGDRDGIRKGTVDAVLGLLRDTLRGAPGARPDQGRGSVEEQGDSG
ncbi:damage-inducible protein CinA [Wenjunlia vitaminophila]|uniref:Damage-inducible protein CinA n=1 Tax=Wenjunlia vitaminophila TaxID=76728 RepID=A0A0T6LZF0_WENVI|nr:CinA family protein [Wenjunlia vitaminophila]KRV51486.1 damage-inducible protein CinA [Wenjunlia vitaminophila]